MKNILIIDDDVHIGNMLEETLTCEGYSVMRAYSGTEALLLLERIKPSLILLDLMLPGISGENLIASMKNIPTIVVSAKFDTESKVSLLLSGAADYITKPFDIKELLARITVALRKSNEELSNVLEFSGIKLDTESHSVMISDVEIKLTRTEYAILKILMVNGDKVVTKSVILNRISIDTPDCTESSLKIHVSNLRKKLRDADGINHIEAVWGIGFRMISTES